MRHLLHISSLIALLALLLPACTNPLSRDPAGPMENGKWKTANPPAVTTLPASAQAAALLAHLAAQPDDFFLALHAGPDAGDLYFTLSPPANTATDPKLAFVQITPTQARALITTLDHADFFAHAVDPDKSPYTRGLTAAIHLYSSATGPRIEYLGWDLPVITRLESLRPALAPPRVVPTPPSALTPTQSSVLSTQNSPPAPAPMENGKWQMANPPAAALDSLLTRLAPLQAYWQQPWHSLPSGLQCRLRIIPPPASTSDLPGIELTLRNNSPDTITLLNPTENTQVGLADAWFDYFPKTIPTTPHNPDPTLPPGTTFTTTVYLHTYARFHKPLAVALQSPGTHLLRLSLPFTRTNSQTPTTLITPYLQLPTPATPTSHPSKAD